MDNSVLYDKIYACWLGKNVGGTLGGPVEGCKTPMTLTDYPKKPSGAMPNDDLDLQLLTLHALNCYGTSITASKLASEWLMHVFFPWDEYGHSLTALRLGLVPPYSGCFDNDFTDCMGAPIRSELWAAIFAGRPDAAAKMAQLDATVDHAGGEGVFGEMFNAALESAAFVSDGQDRRSLISGALSYIPSESRVSGAVRLALDLHRKNTPLMSARQLILEAYGNDNFTDAPQNLAFEVLGFLYGTDFEDCILKTVNLAYDTDCTTATVASLFGIIYGSRSIPEKWREPLGDTIVVSPQIKGFRPPATLDRLTTETLRMYSIFGSVASDELPDVPDDNEKQVFVLPSGAPENAALRIELKYGKNSDLDFTLKNNTTAPLALSLSLISPNGLFSTPEETELRLSPDETGSCRFTYSGTLCDRVNHFALSVRQKHCGSLWCEYRVPFTVLLPSVWKLNGTRRDFPGTTVRFTEPSGSYTAETVLYSPCDRETQLICSASCPVSVILDGETVIACSEPQSFCPAYHRAPKAQRVTLPLSGGRHKVTVRLESETPPLFRLMVTAPKSTPEPGNFFSYTDDIFVE